VVFVGGATVSLYADRIAAEVRPTDDIDILLETLRANRYIREWIDGHSGSYSPPGSYFILSDMDEFIR
jgi:hypothetical protein